MLYIEVFALYFVMGVPMGALLKASRFISFVLGIGAFCFGIGKYGASALSGPWWFWLLSFVGMFGGMEIGYHAEAIDHALWGQPCGK